MNIKTIIGYFLIGWSLVCMFLTSQDFKIGVIGLYTLVIGIWNINAGLKEDK